MTINSFTLTSWAYSDIGPHIFSNSIPDEMMSNLFESLIPTPTASTRVVMIDLQKLIL